jgi:hypothetical protein
VRSGQPQRGVGPQDVDCGRPAADLAECWCHGLSEVGRFRRNSGSTDCNTDHWNFVIGTPKDFPRERDVLASHCADIGRDPKEITLSAHIWLNAEHDCRRVLDEATAFGEEGLDLAITYLRPPLNATVLEPLAEAIRDSGLRDR